MTHCTLLRSSLLAAGLLAAGVAAQTTTHTLTVGGPGSFGCQNANDPPTLDDGVTLASARLDFTYDATTHVLVVDATNTSPVTPGAPNPLLVELAFNLPLQAVTSATLSSQAGSGGAAPAFALAVDVDPTSGSSLKVACFGDFSVVLSRGSIAGGIANASATNWSGPAGAAVVGPVSFVLQLDGPGVGSLTAQSIALQFSQSAPAHQANAAAKFQGGGWQDASGFLGSTASGEACRASMWLSGEARIGTTINLCLGGEAGCHGCILGSETPGPSMIGPFTLPIGLPITLVVPLPAFPPGPVCLPLAIPDDVNLIGLSAYLTIATATGTPLTVEFSPAFPLTVLP